MSRRSLERAKQLLATTDLPIPKVAQASGFGTGERAGRFRGVSVFHTDNPEVKVRPVTEAMRVPAAHGTLCSRPITRALLPIPDQAAG